MASNGVLIVGEAADGALAPISAELVSLGRIVADALGQPLRAALVGHGVRGAAQALASLGPELVLVADDPSLADGQPEATLAALEQIAREQQPEVILVGQTPNMRELAARLAFRLDTAVVTDCTAVRVEDGTLVMTKPVYGGAAVAEVSVDTTPRMATVRPRAYEAAAPAASAGQVQAVALAGPVRPGVTLVETVAEAATAGPRLKDAKVVVSGGRGLGGPDNWHLVEELAEGLGAAVGATRAVTDAGWVPPSHQVGLTGTTITPDLYVTVAVSGAVQHIAGCSGARNIVAINKDPDANIFKHARFGVVGDYKQIVPALTRRIKELRG